jgi:hypothetical protein
LTVGISADKEGLLSDVRVMSARPAKDVRVGEWVRKMKRRAADEVLVDGEGNFVRANQSGDEMVVLVTSFVGGWLGWLG